MNGALHELPVLVLDCQASGATPAYGDLIELGYATCSALSDAPQVASHWVRPRTQRWVSRAVRELTGWSEACLEEALAERDAWERLEQARSLCAAPTPTVIHYARFELPFLRDLYARHECAEFPFDVLCLHAIAARMFPDLPRRNIRALAGFLGHSPELIRRSAGHVAASAHIWRALVPRLEQEGVHTWDELKLWLERPRVPHVRRRRYPLDPAVRRALPDAPGVYRFLRPNGDVLYVGKAASLKKRIASHFTGLARATERGLEMLTQVADIRVTETESVLEAALLESDEIKRIDPPYNVQLRGGERSAWFADARLAAAVPTPDDEHRVGPLPSERSLISLWALIALASGAEATPGLRACALAVPQALLPDNSLFEEGYRIYCAEHLSRSGSPSRLIREASVRLWLARGRAESESNEDAAPDDWDLARVLRRLERSLINGGLLLRRARFLTLLADADVAFRESGGSARLIALERTQLLDRRELAQVADLPLLPRRAYGSLAARQAAFDAASYDRMRVLATELRRVQDEGGEVAARFGTHFVPVERMRELMKRY